MSNFGLVRGGLPAKCFTMWLAPALAGRAIVQVGGSIRLSGDTEPEPDLVVLRLREDRYGFALPGPEDILLVVEVAETSARYDREVKALIYAQAGIPEYWLADLNDRTITRCREPAEDGYRRRLVARGGDLISPEAFPDLHTTPDSIFPPVQ